MSRVKVTTLAGVLAVHAPCALASYHDGALGFMVLVVAVPIWIVSLLAGLGLRSSSAFERDGPRFGFQSIALLIAVVPVILGAPPGDPTSDSMVIGAAMVFLVFAYIVSSVGLGRPHQSSADPTSDREEKTRE